jgi:phospholipase/carboxylesterase
MSYALGLAAGRPAPGGLLAFSGFIPQVEGWAPDLESRAGLPVFVAHGDRDPVIDVSFARQARQRLQAAGLPVSYHESDAGHHIDARHLRAAIAWISGVVDVRPVS